jgi:diguanylate cyclase (GGDEF)-like protein
MPDTDRETARAHAEALRQKIEDEPFPHREKQPGGRVGISGGIAEFPKDGTSVHELLQHADEALYQSKKGGRNRVTCYKGLHIGRADDDPGLDAAAAEPAPVDAEA